MGWFYPTNFAWVSHRIQWRWSLLVVIIVAVFVSGHSSMVWAQSVVVSGTLYDSDRTTVIATEPLLRLAIGGSVVATTSAATDGTYSFPSVSSSGSGEVMTIFVDDPTLSAALVTRDAGSATIADADIYIDHVTLQHEDAGPITNSDIDHFTAVNNAAIPYGISGTALEVVVGHTLYVSAGTTFAPGASVITPELLVAGTYSASTATLELSAGGTPFRFTGAGSFVADQSTVRYTAATNTAMAGIAYHNLITAPSSGSPTYTFAPTAALPAVSQLRLHLDASTVQGLNNNDALGTWSDLSGSGNTLTQTTGTNQPLFQTSVLNSLPAIRFDGNQWLTTSGLTYNQPGQMFVVFEQDGGTTAKNTEVLFDGRPGATAPNLIFMELWTDSTNWRMYSGGSFSFANPGSAANDFGILNTLYNTDSSVARFNGTQLGTGDVAGSQLQGLVLGADRSNGRGFNGHIAEVLFYSQALSSTDQDAIEAYLDYKWLAGAAGLGDVGNATIDGDLTLQTGGGNVDLDLLSDGSSVVVNGDLRIESGQGLSAASTTPLEVGGDFINQGTFTHNDGEVRFTGSDQALSGDTTFYDFTKTSNTTDTFTFAANSTTVVANTWNMEGAAGNLLSLRSSTSSVAWEIDPQGTRTLAYLDIQDSTNLNGTDVDATGVDFVNSGNNTNWQFDSNTISGTVVESDKVTASDVGSEVRLAVDGVLVATTTANVSNGTFTFTGLESIVAGTPITLYLDGVDETGALVDRHPGTTQYEDLFVINGHVSLASGQGGSIANTDIAQYTSSDDAAVPYSASAGDVTVANGQVLYVNQATTFAPAGDVTTPQLEIAGTLQGGNDTLTVTGSDSPFIVTATGTFTANTSTVVYTGIANTSIFPTAYYNLETNPSSGSPTYVFREGATLPIKNSLVLHLDATTITGLTDDDPVTQWDDISGNDNHALDWSGVPNPIYKTNQINGQPVLRYSGSEGLLVPHDASLSTGNVFTIFAVVDLANTSTGINNIRTIISKELDNSDRNYWLVHWDEEWRGRLSDGGALRTVASDANSATTPTTLSYQADGSDLRMWVDDVQQTTVAPYTSIDNQNSPVGIGRQADNQRSWDGDLAEILIFDTGLTSTNREAVEDYLNLKWFGIGTGVAADVEIANNLTLRDGGGNGTIDLFGKNDALTIGGDLSVESDQTLLAASSSPLTIGGDMSNQGNFEHNEGSVEFNGSGQSLSGNTVFYDFTKTSTTSDTFTFAANSATAIENTWTMQGAAGEPLALRSSTPGVQWQINPQGTRSLAYLDIQDSNNTNSSFIDVIDDTYVDSGNNVNWLFEIVTDYFTQRGTTVISGTSTRLVAGNDYVAPEDPDQAFFRITNSSMTGAGATSGGGVQTPESVTVAVTDASDLTSGITLSRFGTSSDTHVDWEIVEYVGIDGGDNELLVRDQGVATFSGSATDAFGTALATVDNDADVAVFITGYRNPATSTAEYNSGLATAAWDTGNQQSEFTRAATGVGGVEVSYAVVEFTGSNWQVQRSEHQYTAGGTTETESITAVNSLSRTFLEAQKRTGSAQTNVNEYGHEVWLSSIGAVSYLIDSNVSTASEHTSVAWVIENTQTGTGAMEVYRSNGTLADGGAVQPQTLTTAIGATVSITESSLWINARSTGINTNFPRPIIGATISSDTEYRVLNSDGGGVQSFRTEVLEWPTAQPRFVQDTYRFYVDDDTLTPSDSWPPGAGDIGENAAITNADAPLGLNDRVRIRTGFRVEDASLPADNRQFKLQYGAKTTTCSNVSFWNDLGALGSGAIWRGYNAAPFSGTVLSSDPPDVADLLLSTSDRAGSYEEENPSAVNQYTISPGESIEYDWHIAHNGAEQDTEYCFRMVESDGTTLADYEVFPTIRTAAFAPEVTSWRWFSDPDDLTPNAPLAAEDTTPIEVSDQDELALRVTVEELAGAAGEDVKLALQYSEYSDFQDGGTMLQSIESCTGNSLWCYTDGAGTDNANIEEAVLSTSDSCTGGTGTGCGTYNEAATTTSSYQHQPFAASEYAFSLQHSGARVNATYYFRLYDVVNDKAIQASSSNPSVVTEGSQLVFSISGLPAGTSTAGVVTSATTTSDSVSFTGLPVNVSHFAAHRLSVSTNATEGYRILKAVTQNPTNSYGENIPSVSATNENPNAWSAACDLTAQTGCIGYHTTDATLAGGSTRFSALDTYAGFSTSLEEVMYSPMPTNESHDIVYQVEVGIDQSAGEYESDVIFVAVPVF